MLSAQEFLEVQWYLLERFVHHSYLDHVVRGHSEAQTEHDQADELVGDGPVAHAQVPQKQLRVLVVAVHFVVIAFHVRSAVAVQRLGYADQRVPQEACGHQRLHDRLDGQTVPHAVDGQREHGRQHCRC